MPFDANRQTRLWAADPPSRASQASKPSEGAAATPPGDFRQATDEARKALARRDLAAAKKLLDAAAKHAREPKELEEVDRLETLWDHLDQFWEAIRTGLTKFSDVEEINVKGMPVIVVESDRDHIVVRFSGRNRRYDIETMPTSLVMTVVKRFVADDVSSHAVVGSFLAVDPKGDRAVAKKYWKEAAAEGIDTEKLLAEIGLFPLAPAATEPKGDGKAPASGENTNRAKR